MEPYLISTNNDIDEKLVLPFHIDMTAVKKDPLDQACVIHAWTSHTHSGV